MLEAYDLRESVLKRQPFPYKKVLRIEKENQRLREREMVKISVGGYDDGEGPSNRHQKRRREEEEEEEERNSQRSFEIVDRSIELQEREDHHHPAPPVRANANGSASNATRVRSIPIFVSDPDVLDCFICYEPMSAPVFQCENGHIACSNCCVRLKNKCPMCLMPIGYNRCRAIEKVLDSIKMSCPNANYGCTETFCYSKKNEHEKECIYLPCLCPHTGCDFVASSKELFLHFSHRHVDCGTQFAYDKFFTVIFSADQKTIVLQEKNDGNLFIVHNNHEHLGHKVRISCIGPKSMAEFQYEVLARFRGSTLILQSFTKIIQGQYAGTPSNAFLLIPSGFFGPLQLKLDIRIKSH